MASKNSVCIRVDSELAQQIKDFAKKNNMKIKQASKEMAKLNRVNLSNRKIMMEIKF
jgi:hypothetical protein